nr:membrane protein [uncultured bacterium]
MKRKILITGSILGLTAVILGAFGAHGLKDSLTVEALNSFETGVRYQMYHSFLLLFVSSILPLNTKSLNTIFYLVISGIILFSGSIYLLSTKALTGIDISAFAWITPIGGALLISAWISITYSLIKSAK